MHRCHDAFENISFFKSSVNDKPETTRNWIGDNLLSGLGRKESTHGHPVEATMKIRTVVAFSVA
jgi:hypothetical protein